MKRDAVYQSREGWAGFFAKVLIAIIAMGVLVAFGMGEISIWLNLDVWHRILHLLLWVSAGAAVYFILLWTSGLRLSHMTAPA